MWHSWGRSPHHVDHLAVLEDASAPQDLQMCDDVDDRRWVLQRLEQAQAMAAGIDWDASAPGDRLAPHPPLHRPRVADAARRLMVTLVLNDLRAARELGRWQLGGLRRTSPLARHLEAGGAGPP